MSPFLHEFLLLIAASHVGVKDLSLLLGLELAGRDSVIGGLQEG